MKALKLSVLAMAVVFATVTLVTYACAHDREDTGHHKLTITIVYNDVNDKEAADIARRVNAANSGACKVEVQSEKISTQYIGWTTDSYSVTQNSDGSISVNPMYTTEAK